MSINLAVVKGTCSSPAEVRLLASGTRLVQLQLTVRTGDGPAVSVPVAVADPPSWVEVLEEGDEVVAWGRVRRRFFRAGGATASRVEVEAEAVARATDRRRIRAALRRTGATLEALLE